MEQDMTRAVEDAVSEQTRELRARIESLELERDMTAHGAREATQERDELERRLTRALEDLESARAEVRAEQEKHESLLGSLRAEREARAKAEQHAKDLEMQLEALTGVSHKREEVTFSRFTVDAPMEGLSLRRYLVQHNIEATFDSNSRTVIAKTTERTLRNLVSRWRREVRDYRRHLRSA